MIPAVRLGITVFRMGFDQLVRAPTALRLRPGSEWWELVIHASLVDPERWAGPPHGHPSRWDWGFTLRSLVESMQRYEHLRRIVANLTPEQHAELWSDTSEQAARLRRVMRLDAARARAAG